MDYKLPKLPHRDENSNKGTFGKILNVSGSKYMPGAAYLSSISALKSGAGYVVLASDENVLSTVSVLSPEIVLAKTNKIPELAATSTVLLTGCGLSTSLKAVNLLKKTLKYARNLPAVIDADGLNIIAKVSIKLPEKKVFTPHPKEASRLLHCSLEYVLDNMELSAKNISEKYNCITVLKSHGTIVTSPDGKIYYNTTGSNALAKAGSGDVLSGIIAGLIAQKMNLFDAACLGVYLHGLAGDLAKNNLTEYGVLASDTVRYIPDAFNDYINRKS